MADVDNKTILSNYSIPIFKWLDGNYLKLYVLLI